MRWEEVDGPEVVPPQSRSGSKIIESLVAASGGRIAYDWRRSGLVATLEFPVYA